ncbi:MAG: hypothetical protein ACOVOA_01645, partial [Allorhizobium sp.]
MPFPLGGFLRHFDVHAVQMQNGGSVRLPPLGFVRLSLDQLPYTSKSKYFLLISAYLPLARMASM